MNIYLLVSVTYYRDYDNYWRWQETADTEQAYARRADAEAKAEKYNASLLSRFKEAEKARRKKVQSERKKVRRQNQQRAALNDIWKYSLKEEPEPVFTPRTFKDWLNSDDMQQYTIYEVIEVPVEAEYFDED